MSCDDMGMVECVVVATGTTARLPMEQAMRLAALGRVRLPAPKPDPRYGPKPAPLPIRSTWADGFSPGRPVTR